MWSISYLKYDADNKLFKRYKAVKEKPLISDLFQAACLLFCNCAFLLGASHLSFRIVRGELFCCLSLANKGSKNRF
jgi:hypothetical protein